MMAESTTEHRKPGTKWWGAVFQKKKKKKMVEILTECNVRLTTMIEDQSRLISSLTFENGRNDQIIRDYEQKIQNLSDSIQKLEDKSKRDQEFLESQRDKLQHQYYDIQLLTNEKQDWLNDKISLEQEKKDLDIQIKENKEELFKTEETKNKLQDEKTTLKEKIASLKDDLVVSNQTLYEETVKNKLLEKDNHLLQDNLTDTKMGLERARKKIEDLQNSLLVVTSEKYKIEHELGALNECLKYEMVVLNSMVSRKRKKIVKLERDKQLIRKYYRRQELDNNNVGNHVDSQLKLQISPFVEVPYAEFLKNKVLSLEGQLYRRSRLVDVLCDVIREYDPDFDIDSSPDLQQYLDRETILPSEISIETDQTISTQDTVYRSSCDQQDSSRITDESIEDSVSYSSSLLNSTSLDEIDFQNENQSAILQKNDSLNKLSVCNNDESLAF